MIDAAERLALDWLGEQPLARLVVWGEDVRALAAAARARWPELPVSMWNDFAGPAVAGVEQAVATSEVDTVLVRLPKALAALEDWAAHIRSDYPNARVVAAGMIKHMSLSQNEALARFYGQLDISHARQKARLLIASQAHAETRKPTHATVLLESGSGAAAGLTLASRGGVFANARLDIGTRLLLDTLDQRLPADGSGASAIDLGSGSGVIAAWLARRGYRVLASDISQTAVDATAATAAANGLTERITTLWSDALEGEAPAQTQLVVLNPPFHDRATVTTNPARRLFAAAARALQPEGVLVTVWNSHLAYRRQLEHIVGPSEQWARNSKFTVTASRRN